MPLITLLDITPEEEVTLNLKSIKSNFKKIENKHVRNKEYYKENKEEINFNKRNKYKDKLKKEGKLNKEQQKEEIKEKIKSLLEKGFTQKDIAKQLSIGIATVKRYVKKIKEELL